MRLFIAQIFDFILPRICCHCSQKLLLEEQILCKQCFKILEYNPPELLAAEYHRKFDADGFISEFYSLYKFTSDSPIQSAVHSLKYGNNIKAGQKFGNVAAKHFTKNLNSLHIDYIIPIPLHPLKKAGRGYNQSYYFAKGLSEFLRIPLLNNCVRRVRNTPTQTKLDISERKLNIENAFVCRNRKKIIGKNILIVDDVITTGATMNECGKVLKEKRAKKIFALSIGLAE